MMYYNKNRACLLMVAVAATVGGILYWCSNCKKERESIGMHGSQMGDEEMSREGCSGTTIKSAAKNTGKELKRAASVSGQEMKQAAATVGQEIKQAASSVGHEWKEAAKSVGRDIKHEFSDEDDQ